MKKSKYEELLKEIINTSFPMLKDKKIHLLRCILIPFSAMAAKEFFGYIVYINPLYEIYSEFEVKGILAHELCHIEDWEIKGRKWRIKNRKLCLKDKNYNQDYEKATDIRAIVEKKYGKELLSARITRENKPDTNYKKNKDSYLTSEEIKQILLKKGLL